MNSIILTHLMLMGNEYYALVLKNYHKGRIS